MSSICPGSDDISMRGILLGSPPKVPKREFRNPRPGIGGLASAMTVHGIKRRRSLNDE
jgi:hypothetical protein